MQQLVSHLLLPVMVTLELNLPSARKALPGSLQQVDPVAALQQLIENQRVPRAPRSLAAERQEAEVDTSLQPLHIVSQAPQRYSVQRETKPSTSQTPSPRSAQRTYSNDGVRLSELGEQPLAIGKEISDEQHQELSFSLPDPETGRGSHSRGHGAASEQLHPKRNSYVCSIKDDPLVKGRSAF